MMKNFGGLVGCCLAACGMINSIIEFIDRDGLKHPVLVSLAKILFFLGLLLISLIFMISKGIFVYVINTNSNQEIINAQIPTLPEINQTQQNNDVQFGEIPFIFSR
jgi:hypothetical protein